MERARRIHWGGVALMLGTLVFLPVKIRHLVDPDDSLLGIFLWVGFTAWLVGLVALYSRYQARAGRLGKIGLITNIVGIVFLAIGHLGSFILQTDLFLFVVVGTLGLIIGALLFGIAALRAPVLPTWRSLPLATGLLGLAWIFLTNSETSRGRFLVLRTLFGLGWLLLGYILWSDRSGVAMPAERRISNTPDEQVPVGGS